jgi:hypothetical protein
MRSRSLRLILWSFAALFFLVSVVLIWTQRHGPSLDFWHYPPAYAWNSRDGVQEFIRLQTGDDYLTANRTALVAISTLQAGEKAAQLQSVKPNGREWHVLDVVDWAMQAMGQRQLTAPQVEQLRQAVHDLPEQGSYPDAGHLVIVSFRDDSGWITRYYDQRAPPEALKRIQAIIAAAHELTFLEEQAEAAAAARKMVIEARAAMPPGAPPAMKLADAVSQSVAIFTGTLTNLDGPRDAQLGEARYYGTVLLGQTLRGPVASHSAVFNAHGTTDPGTFVSIDARLLPAYDENQANIFFGVKTDYEHPRTTVGSDYTILAILPASDANLAKVRKLLPPPDSTK